MALDLDGTLLTSDKTLSPRTVQAVERVTRAGTKVVLCTGRPPRTARPFAERLKLVELAIVYNGGAIYDFARDTALCRYDFPVAVAHEAIERLRARYPDVMCGAETAYGWFVDTARYEIVRRGRVPYETEPDGVGEVERFLRESVTKLLFWHPTASAETLAAALDGVSVHCTWSMPGLLEVIAPEVNKQVALARVAADLGLQAREVAAFGDQNNDKEMLAWAGLGVAMGNGSESVRALADLVAPSNDEDGVAQVLEAWL
ncbi:Cof-type HAD-IIB family hydrolase [Truepera radiovictrix]|uniref:Cof-type HAD-IIB family hydrolase n=1 Tax=Truepera radiovictrix TaxID=332249 RepID=UPI002479B17D|nr:Cof-type HAD-IIB family hydrolase [Truepera radiovictrix]